MISGISGGIGGVGVCLENCAAQKLFIALFDRKTEPMKKSEICFKVRKHGDGNKNLKKILKTKWGTI